MSSQGAATNCLTCGFLALRAKSGLLVEASEGYRENGAFESAHFDKLPMPICANQRRDFREAYSDYVEENFADLDINSLAAKFDNPGRFDLVRAIGQPFLCRDTDAAYGWAQWTPGVTPQGLREMLDRKWMMEREDRRDDKARGMRGLNSG